MNLLKIGDTILPVLDDGGYNVTLNDLDSDNTGRSESGYMTRERIRANVYTIDCKWTVSGTELATISNAIVPTTFTLTFFDPITSTTKSGTFYASGSKSANLKYVADTIAESTWELSFSFIEC